MNYLLNRRKAFRDYYTKLLLHCNGIDTSTDFPDASFSNHTITAVGDAQVDTSDKKFGTGSALFDGTGDRLTCPSHNDFNFEGGDFTVDFQFKFSSLPTFAVFLSHWNVGNEGWLIYKVSNQILFQYSTDGSTDISKTVSYTYDTTTWHHMEVSRSGTTLKIFVDEIEEEQ